MCSINNTESAGARFKKLRLEKGLSLEEVHKKTKLHLNILRAIEEDSLINFSPVYIKGFLKIYCKFLGIDPRDCIPDYKESQRAARYVSGSPQKAAPSVLATPPKPLFSLKGMRLEKRIVFSVILILIFITGLFYLGKRLSFKQNIARSQKTRLSAANPSAVENKVRVTRPQGPVSAKEMRLDIRAKENCFVRLKTDGRLVFQNILRKGRAESWQATDKIEISLGNAGAVELEVNGKRISNLGKRGEALNILITKEGLVIRR